MDPRDTPKLAETESLLWTEAQNSQTQGMDRTQVPVQLTISSIPGRWCFTDGSWKSEDIYLGQGWYSTLEGYDGLMGATNTRASQSPLHSEIEALIYA